jgi:uncharacterized membrane protein
MSAPIATTYRVGLGAWTALAALQLIWHGWLFPVQSMPVPVALAISFIPLLLPLLAIRNVQRALLWVGILSLFYFCHGVSEAWSAPGERVLAWIEILLTLTLIGTLGLGVRHKRMASRT